MHADAPRLTNNTLVEDVRASTANNVIESFIDDESSINNRGGIVVSRVGICYSGRYVLVLLLRYRVG